MKRVNISSAQVAALKSRVPLSALIGERVPLQRDTRTEFVGLCPFHAEDTPSFRVYPDHFHCFGCGEHGDAVDWLQHHDKMSFAGAVRHLREWSGETEPQTVHVAAKSIPTNYGWMPILPVPSDAPALVNGWGWTYKIFNPKRKGERGEWATWRPALVHPYCSAGAELLGYVLRIETASGKFTPTITFCRNDAGERRWCLISFPSPRPLYGLDRLVARPRAPVVLVEGEKTADAAQRLLPSMVALTWPGGTNGYPHVDWAPLAGRKVICIPDADAPGRDAFAGRTNKQGKRVAGIVEILTGLSAKVRRVEPSAGLPDGWDLADAERDGWTTDRVVAWIKANLVEESRHVA